jgi:hypothetical protein
MDSWTASAMKEAFQEGKKHKDNKEYKVALKKEETLRTDFNKESFRLVYEKQLRKKAGKELAKEKERIRHLAGRITSSSSDDTFVEEVARERAIAESHRTRAARTETREAKLADSLPVSARRPGEALPIASLPVAHHTVASKGASETLPATSKRLSEVLPKSNHAAVGQGFAYPAENFKGAHSLPIPIAARPLPSTMSSIGHQNAGVHVQVTKHEAQGNVKQMILHAKE